ncbi:MAG: hypothetical protein FJ109_20150 [Deltaproteobacteria bacterium]|nr:hypothetical protein [Deltaproteobacteria bacterium]
MHLPLIVASFLLSAALPTEPSAAGPTADLFAGLARLDLKSGPLEFAPFVHPARGLDVDVSSEGSPAPSIVHVDVKTVEKTYDRAVKPLLGEGLFKSPPRCSPDGRRYRCTLQTPASLPRTCTLEPSGGKWFLTRIEWARDEPDPQDEEDDDLPM